MSAVRQPSATNGQQSNGDQNHQTPPGNLDEERPSPPPLQPPQPSAVGVNESHQSPPRTPPPAPPAATEEPSAAPPPPTPTAAEQPSGVRDELIQIFLDPNATAAHLAPPLRPVTEEKEENPPAPPPTPARHSVNGDREQGFPDPEQPLDMNALPRGLYSKLRYAGSNDDRRMIGPVSQMLAKII
ncbi:hypothetical protein B0T16DRAFT_395301 [Cercophora newfieldiana]|uniref:Uncharacterized protein n=1 Tax=Cercophora newfieldiana TaxID=92897 RepID=A0AA39XSU6_9PEZI|nr:hypothetical protein B0T16DRAFT_395301 [Cercophora newfieldiana]